MLFTRFSPLLAALMLSATAALAQTAQSDSVGDMKKVTLHAGKAELSAEIAASHDQGERGLMWRTHLADNDGMLFFLPRPDTQEFWMKNTLIPLSIAYIDKNGVILEIHDMKAGDPNIPDSQVARYRSESNQVAYALEMNLHWFALNSVKAGDKITPAPATLGSYVP